MFISLYRSLASYPGSSQCRKTGLHGEEPGYEATVPYFSLVPRPRPKIPIFRAGPGDEAIPTWGYSMMQSFRQRNAHVIFIFKVTSLQPPRVVNSSEELSLRKSAFSHRSHYLGKRQQCVMFDYEVGVLVAVRIFNPDCHAA